MHVSLDGALSLVVCIAAVFGTSAPQLVPSLLQYHRVSIGMAWPCPLRFSSLWQIIELVFSCSSSRISYFSFSTTFSFN